YFENADAILRAVVEAEAERFEAGIALEADSPAALRAALVEYGTRLLGFLNEADVLRFSRLMYEQARSHPDVAKTFYDAAYGRSHAKLAAFIGQGIAAGHVRSALTGDELAEMLLGMWEPVRFVRAQLALTDQPYADPAAWSEKCVATLFGEGTALGEDG
ncbi:MAG: TetR/AcrR family transcriptional regulator C-terminal domain-containing protein, partial [Pseudomonadota bacterium]